MRITPEMPLSRRTVLRGLGATLALPLLDCMKPRSLAAAESMDQSPRLVCCYVPQGVNEAEWFPAQEGRGYRLSPTLSELTPHRNDFTLISGLGHPESAGAHEGADNWLTGADLDGTPGADYRNSQSLDQLVAARLRGQTRLPSLELSAAGGTGSTFHSHTLAFDAAGNPLPTENSPQRLFDRLFVPPDARSQAEAGRRRASDQSILDLVGGEARRLSGRLGADDRRKLDQYLASVRQTERMIADSGRWDASPRPAVSDHGLRLTADPRSRHDRTMWLDTMLDLAALALETDQTRVVTFEWDSEPGGLGSGDKNHHEMSHHLGDQTMLRELAAIDRFYVSRLKRLLDRLARREADAPLLDSTMVLYGSGMSNGATGGHSPKNVPLLLAGGRDLGLAHNRHLRFPVDSRPMCDLLLSIGQFAGLEIDRFGDSRGTLTGLS